MSMFVCFGWLTFVVDICIDSNLVAVVYPAYCSIKALNVEDGDHTHWLIYWVIYAFYQVFDFLLDILLSWYALILWTLRLVCVFFPSVW